VLLVAAGLMIRSLTNLVAADRGFDPRNVLTMDLQLTGPQYRSQGSQLAFHRQLLDQLGALVGVEKAALTWPLFGGWYWDFRVEGEPPASPGQEEMRAAYKAVSPEYFETMKISLLRGRFFEESDRLASAPVVIVDQSLAARYWPDGDWIGRRLKTNTGDPNAPWAEVIGVVGHVKNEAKAGPQKQIYQPLFQKVLPRVSVVLRTTRDPRASRPPSTHGSPDGPAAHLRPTLDEYFGSTPHPAVHYFCWRPLREWALLPGHGDLRITRYSISRRTGI
jgi:hypothetical protein